MRRRWLGLLLLPCLAAAGELEQAFEQMQQALRERDYHGVVVTLRDGQLEALKVGHRAAGNSSWAEPLTGASDSLQRYGDRFETGRGEAFQIASVEVGPTQLPEGYDLRMVGEDRVAGRACRVIEARPRDALRYARRLWLDLDSGLLLRSQVANRDGQVIDQWMFTSLEYAAAEPSRRAAGDAEPLRFRGPQADQLAQTRFRIVQPPSGFVLAAAAVDDGSEHLVFADGLARVSVFIEPVSDQQAVLSGSHRRGALSVVGRLLEGAQVVVVGEVPASTAERFAQSLVRR